MQNLVAPLLKLQPKAMWYYNDILFIYYICLRAEKKLEILKIAKLELEVLVTIGC